MCSNRISDVSFPNKVLTINKFNDLQPPQSEIRALFRVFLDMPELVGNGPVVLHGETGLRCLLQPAP